MGDGGWKRIAGDGNSRKVAQKKNFWFVKVDGFHVRLEEFSTKENAVDWLLIE